jgi:uncharacterized protein YbjT (DUF2867 family)
VAILVTGAAGTVGRAAVQALLRQGVEHVRAVVRDPGQGEPLRRLGAKVAAFDATDTDYLEGALAGVFTAVGLAGGAWTRPGQDPREAVLAPTRALVAAARTAQVRRLVLVVPAAADAGSGNPYLAGAAEAAELVTGSGLEYAVLRCTHVLAAGSPLLQRLRVPAPVPVPGAGTQTVAPVHARDVARAIAAADDREHLTGTWTLGGPEAMPFDTLVDLVRGTRDPKRHLGAPDDGDLGGFTATQLDYLARDSVLTPTVGELGVTPGPVTDDLAVAPAGPRSVG